jgi:hypothetical protein
MTSRCCDEFLGRAKGLPTVGSRWGKDELRPAARPASSRACQRLACRRLRKATCSAHRQYVDLVSRDYEFRRLECVLKAVVDVGT